MDVASLNNTATQYKPELILLPIIGMEEAQNHMIWYPGIQNDMAISMLYADVQLRPYNGTANNQDGLSTGTRTLNVYMGDVYSLEDPEDLRATILGRKLLGNSKPGDSHPLELDILKAFMASVSKKLGAALFKAVRNSSGTTTLALFNGFDTLTATEISGGDISEGNGNLQILGAITAANAVDTLHGFYQSAAQELQSMPTKLYIPWSVYWAYAEGVKDDFGSVVYNTEFQKRYLMCAPNMCELVPLVGKAGSNYIHLSVKENMALGTDVESDRTYIEVRRGDNPYKWQFVMKYPFGVQFASIDDEYLCVGDISSGSGS